MGTNILTLDGIEAFYGDSHVLHKVSMTLGEGRLLGLLGRNGAGKSTSMSVAMGVLTPRRGLIYVGGKNMTKVAPEAMSASGVALVPQGRRIFKSLTVRENLSVASRKPKFKSQMPWSLARVYETFPRLQERQNQTAGLMSGGEQQMLAIGRALMTNPRVLLMDEPSEGLAPQIISEVMSTIRKLKDDGLSIILVEQNAKLVLEMADDIVVLNSGQVAVSGKAVDLLRDGIDLHQYLGVF